jgi:glycosyltransferase involved in cell wall biosynthesis
MKVSVVIPAFNEEKFLSKTIEAVRANEISEEDYEIIVVNNGSSDRTAEIARRAGVTLVESERRFVGAARNMGARVARGEVLSFLDADCIPKTDWLREGIKSLDQEKCVTGAQCEAPDDAGWIERVWFSHQRTGRIEIPHINSGNLIIHRSLFFEIGGFDETLSSGEDFEFCSRAKSRVRIIADNKIRVVHLGNPKTIKDFIAREIWHGMGALGSLKYHKFDKPLIGTAIFGIFSLLQFFGLVDMLYSGSINLFVMGTAGVIALLVLTVLNRLLTGVHAQEAGALFILYYLYYLGRMIALGKLLIGQRNYQRKR